VAVTNFTVDMCRVTYIHVYKLVEVFIILRPEINYKNITSDTHFQAIIDNI